MDMRPWEYRKAVERVVDGDTLDLRIDLGVGVILTGSEARVRLKDLNTAEIFEILKQSDEYDAGQAHRQFVVDWVSEAADGEWPFLVRTVNDDERGKYGRWLAVISRRNDEAVLNENLNEAFGDAVRN